MSKDYAKEHLKERVRKLERIISDLQERLHRSPQYLPCQKCVFWVRGYEPSRGRVVSTAAKWGKCGWDKRHPVIGADWFSANDSDIITSENFGCVNGSEQSDD